MYVYQGLTMRVDGTKRVVRYSSTSSVRYLDLIDCFTWSHTLDAYV